MSKISVEKIYNFILSIIMCIILFSGSSVFASYRYLFIAICAGVVFIANAIKNEGKFKLFLKPIYNRILLIIIVILTLNVPFSYNIKSSIKYITFFTIIYVTSLSLFENENFFKRLIKAILVSSMILAFSILLCAVFGNYIEKYFSFLLPKSVASLRVFRDELRRGAYSGFAFERSYAATGLTLGISIIFSNIVVDKKIKKSEIVALVILLVALFCTGKRMLLLINMFTFLFVFFINGKKENLVKFLKLSVILSIFLIIILIYVPQTRRVFVRFLDKQGPNTIEARNENYWVYCLEMFSERPIAGYGINSFVDYITSKNVREIFNAHNIYFQLLAETGIIGLSIFLILFGYLLIFTYKKLKEFKNDEYKSKLINISLLLQIIFLIYGLSGNTLYYFAQVFIYFIAIMIVNNLSFNKEED